MKDASLLLQSFAALALDPRSAVLIVLLIAASVTDYRTRKIPNYLTLSGIVFGLVYSTAFSFNAYTGFMWAMGGLLVGFAIMLPLYLVRAMGAGDVKLMAMTGACIGIADTIYAAIFTFIVGGIAALVFALFNKAFIRLIANLKEAAISTALSVMGGYMPNVQIEKHTSIGKLPYGVCIAIGTIASLVAKQMGYA